MRDNAVTHSFIPNRDRRCNLEVDWIEENLLRRRSTSSDQFAFDFNAKVNVDSATQRDPVSAEKDNGFHLPEARSDSEYAAPISPLAVDLPVGCRPAKAKKSPSGYGPTAVEDTLVRLQEFERKLVSEGREVPRRQRTVENVVSKRAIATELGVSPNRLLLPGVPEAIDAMADRIGIEPVEKRAFVQDILKRIEDLADHLRRTGGKLPRNFMSPLEPSYKGVRELLGLPHANRFPEPAERRIIELYNEIGPEDAPLPVAEQRVLAWCERARAEGLRVPACSSKPKEPFIPACIALMGVDAADLYHAPNQAILTALGDEIGFEIVATARDLRPMPSLVLVEEWSKREGQKVPQHASYPGRPWVAAACEQIGISTASASRPAVRDAIVRVSGTLGFATVIESVEPDAVLLQELRQKAIAMRREEVSGTKAENAQIGNLTWRLNQLAELHPDGELADARFLLDEAATIKPGDSKFHGEMRVLKRCLNQIELSRGLSDDFCEALRELCKRAKISYKGLSREAGFSPHTVAQWVNRCPAPNRRKEVELVERTLNAEPMTLVSRMASASPGARFIPLSRFPDHVRDDRELRKRIKARFKPGDLTLPEAAFMNRCREIEAEINANTKQRSAFVKARKHGLEQLPDLVDRQFAVICKVADTDGPKRRQAMIDHGFCDEKLRWSEATVKGHERTLKAFFGYLSEPVEHRPAIDLRDMSLALALVPKLAMEYAIWLPTLRTAGASAEKVSRTDTAVPRLFATLLRPGGVLRRMPHLAETLRPIPGYLDKDRVLWTEANWQEACAAAWESCQSLNGSYSDDEFQRPGEMARLMPILSLDDPRQAVIHVMLRRLREARALMAEGNLSWALAVRDELYVHVQEQMVLREETLRQVEPQHFRTAGNSIRLHLPREFFKNRTSQKVWKPGKFWIDFERDFDGELGALAVYDLYVNRARPLLIGVRTDPGSFFVTEGGEGLKEFSKVLKARSLEFLIDHPDADDFWKQQGHLRNHDFRHIVATTMIRRTGRWEDAAHALMDTTATVESTYGFLRAEDTNARFREIMKARGTLSP
jgi:hypothetical protein